MFLADILLAKSSGAEGCCGCFPFIVILVIVISALSKSQKSGSSGSGGSLLGGMMTDLQNMANQAQQQYGQNTGGGLYSQGSVVRKVRQPVNWALVKLNMTQDQINDCFDMDELARGVKKKDIAKYVHLDKLRQYYSDPQLEDMIDLDFFNAEEAKFAAAATTLPGLKSQQLKGLSAPHLRGLSTSSLGQKGHSRPAFEEIVEEKIIENLVSDIFSENSTEAFSPKPTLEYAKDIMAFEDLLEKFKELANKDAVFYKMSQKLTDEECVNLYKRFEQISADSSTPQSIGDATAGIIWSEILQKRKTGFRFRRF